MNLRDQRTPVERIEAIVRAAGLYVEWGGTSRRIVVADDSDQPRRGLRRVTIWPLDRQVTPGIRAPSSLGIERTTGRNWPERLAQRAIAMLAVDGGKEP